MTRILVMDDEERIVKFCRTILESLRYKVDTATNSHEFMEAIQRNEYALLITDLQMPEMDGLMCIEKARENNPSIGVMIITGTPLTSTQYGAIKSVAFRIITKPFNAMDLQGAVIAYFELAKE